MPAESARRTRSTAWLKTAFVLVVAMGIAGCASRRPIPPLPAVLAHPDFLYPAVPARLIGAPGASRVDVGWHYLQVDDLRGAALEFDVALNLGPDLFPAMTGQGYVWAARGDQPRAIRAFDRALAADPRYVPALVGRALSLLSLDSSARALEDFEAALAVDPGLDAIARRVEVLRFRVLDEVIQEARRAATTGAVEQARRAYARAIDASPESPFLHREAAELERSAGNPERALEHVRRARELDPNDASALVTIGDLLDARGDAAGAELAYRDALTLDPGLDLDARLDAVAARAREGELPAQFASVLEAARVTRGDLAALLGVRLGSLLRQAPSRQVVMTDVQNHWAVRWIPLVAGSGAIEAFENHTFQPEQPVRRGDLATIVSRLVDLIAMRAPELRARAARRLTFADLAVGHLQYDAASVAVASGVMTTVEGDRFDVGRPVSGPEAVEVIDRVRALDTAAGGPAGP